jgi:hypothetical protein
MCDFLVGSLYVFTRGSDASSWIRNRKITAPDAAKDDKFGFDVSLDNFYLVVGAYGDDDKGMDSGEYCSRPTTRQYVTSAM